MDIKRDKKGQFVKGIIPPTAWRKGKVPWNKKDVPKGICLICKINPVGMHSSYCNPCNAKQQREWRSKNKEKYSQSNKRNRIKLRKEVLTHYGGNPPKCACCGESHYEFLSIDHINNDGKQHRKQVGIGMRMYYWLRKNNYPKGFQVLCFNCNLAKGFSGKCPHQK